MTLANGRHMLAIPGPSVMPDRVLRAMHRAAPNIYSGELVEMTASLVPDLKAVAQTEGQVAMYIGNGHAAWEASLVNVLSPGDKVLVASNGQFSSGWAGMAERLGIQVSHVSFGKRAAVDPAKIEDALRADKAGEFKAVLLVQTDTATSARSDVAAIRKAMTSVGHSALLMVDAIASLGCDEMRMDAWGVDVLVAACQKGLMTPPGMAFVFFNERAEARRAVQTQVSPYWDWVPRARPEQYYQYSCGTAPTHHIYGLREALDMIVHEEGIAAVLSRHQTLAQAVWAAFEAWSTRGPIELNISERAARGHAVTAIRIGAPLGTQLRDWVTANAGVTLGIGLGMATPDDPAWHGFFRLGHMGHLNTPMLMGTLGAIQSGLNALEIEHGSGALDAAAAICAVSGGAIPSEQGNCCM